VEVSESREESPLSALAVLDRIEIGPTRIEPRALITPYRVVIRDQQEETELRYRYQEDVFIPGDPSSLNLASMIGAQVALNYGLFTKEMVFHGPFDEHDQAFLVEMAANTAREIYVNKILKPNPLLTGASRVGFEKRDNYLQAAIRFPDDPGESGSPLPTALWQTTGGKVGVLSSGGKESLLSYGLLEELGLDTHALFVNESGRHWYTALNGFRHLEATAPERTVRVWTSADRLFAWMLRRLPFVRPDFQDVRATVCHLIRQGTLRITVLLQDREEIGAILKMYSEYMRIETVFLLMNLSMEHIKLKCGL